jgi:hypothetical protein
MGTIAALLAAAEEAPGLKREHSWNTPSATGRKSPKVKSHSSIDRLLVVFHSPTSMAKTGLLACRSEKTGRVSRCNAKTKDLSLFRFDMETSQLAEISRDYRRTASGFLCAALRAGRAPRGARGLKPPQRPDVCTVYTA